jgi:ribosomal protein L12E/L44/L45/RPP1/RPP2
MKGTMRGSYTLVGQESGTMLEAIVAPFALSPPKAETKAAETKGNGLEGGGDRSSAANEEETEEEKEERLLEDQLNLLNDEDDIFNDERNL